MKNNLIRSSTPPSSRVSIPLRRAAGFTLFEILTVVLIIGIAGMMVVPTVGTNLHGSRLKTAANILAADIDFCQSECISNPSALRQMQFDTTLNKYWIATAANAGTPITHPADSQPYLNNFSTGRASTLQGVTLTSATIGTNSTVLTFDAYGKPNLTSNAVFVLSDGARTLTITVNASTGDVTIN